MNGNKDTDRIKTSNSFKGNNNIKPLPKNKLDIPKNILRTQIDNYKDIIDEKQYLNHMSSKDYKFMLNKYINKQLNYFNNTDLKNDTYDNSKYSNKSNSTNNKKIDIETDSETDYLLKYKCKNISDSETYLSDTKNTKLKMDDNYSNNTTLNIKNNDIQLS